MREIFTSAQAADRGLSRSALEWGLRAGLWTDAGFGAYVTGPEPATLLERSAAAALVTNGLVSGTPAGELLRLDSVIAQRVDFTVAVGTSNARAGARRRDVYGDAIEVDGVLVTSGLQTLIDLAHECDDLVWEQALESALRLKLTTIDAMEQVLPALGAMRTPGVKRMRRVLSARPVGAPPTESLLETLMIQLIRDHELPTPARQVRVMNRDGVVIARVDLAWPELGVFVELDGQHHLGQPVHDANRQTAIIAATGWLCARFTWREVVHNKRAVARQLREVLDRAAELHRG